MADILTSLHGKKVGLDVNGNLLVEKGYRRPAAAASTAATILAGGITLMANSTAASFTIEAPYAGAEKILIATSASTSQVVTTPTTGVGFQSTAASTSGAIYRFMTFTGIGQAVSLVGVSAATWQIRSAHASVLLTTV